MVLFVAVLFAACGDDAPGTPAASGTNANLTSLAVTTEDGTTTKDHTIRVYRMGADYTSTNIGALKYVPTGAFQRDATAANISFVSAFRMSRTEITRSQYSNVMAVDPSSTGSSNGSTVFLDTRFYPVYFKKREVVTQGGKIYVASVFPTLIYGSRVKSPISCSVLPV